MSNEIPTKFSGYGALNKEQGAALDLVPVSYTPKKFTEDDVIIKIVCCGICGSDIHTITDGWPSPTSYNPCCIVGHEIVGHVVRAGSRSGHEIGARVGVGAQAHSCLECEWCVKGEENMCEKGMGGTYASVWPEDGSLAQGGYADYVSVRGKFAIAIPEALESFSVAPLLCAGATVFAPLKRFGAGPGKRVGVIGIGGLGHLALLFSQALGAETYALSHSTSKLADAEKLGIKPENFIATKDEASVIEKYSRHFDIIICTAFFPNLPIESLYFKLLRPYGTLVLCGLPEEKLAPMFGQALVGKCISLAGSLIAGTADIKEMLDLAAAKDIKAWVEVRPLTEAKQAIQDMHAGAARYRYVLDASK